MITRIEVYDYRCFPRLSLDLGRYHVLAGANGAGKTTLLDIPTLLGDLLRQRQAAAAFLDRQDLATPPRANTLVELLHKRQGEQIAFAVEARLPDEIANGIAGPAPGGVGPGLEPTHLRYELGMHVTTRDVVVSDEYLFLYAEQGARPAAGAFPQGRPKTATRSDWWPVISRTGNTATKYEPESSTAATDIPALRVPPGQLALGTVPADPTLFPSALWFAQLLREGAVFFDPSWDLLRQPAPPGDSRQLLASGRNTPWLALDLSQRDPEAYSSWVDHVRTALPQISDIRAVEREEDRYAYFSVEYSGGYRVTSSGLSDGTLRILAMTLLPYLGAEVLPELLITEEPENGIHPRAIETVVDSLHTLYESQVWVSTHSPIVLAHTDLADVLAARLTKDGSVDVVPGNQHPRLRDWHGSLDIGTLFAAGVLS